MGIITHYTFVQRFNVGEKPSSSLTSLRAAIENGACCFNSHRRESAVRYLSRTVPASSKSLHLQYKHMIHRRISMLTFHRSLSTFINGHCSILYRVVVFFFSLKNCFTFASRFCVAEGTGKKSTNIYRFVALRALFTKITTANDVIGRALSSETSRHQYLADCC